MTRAVRPLLVPVLAAACLLTALPAAQASNVGVRFEVSLVHHFPPGPPYAACDLGVPAGSDGVAVLEAAVASGCISDYSTKEFEGFGRYVDCIDGICEVEEGLVAYWALFYEDTFADTGLDGFSAAPGREIEFTFTSLNCWVGVC